MSMITIYTLAYNEEYLMQFMIDHYRSRFAHCNIVIYDNLSTDNTVAIAKKNNCIIIPFDTNNQFSDSCHLEIKNNCWKSAQTDWVLVADFDELLDITQDQLAQEEFWGSTIIQNKTYDMISLNNNEHLEAIKYGVPSPINSKTVLFNKRYIHEMNYTPGCHACDPKGTIQFSRHIYNLYHYASLGEEYTVRRFKQNAARLSEENLRHGWGYHYLMTPDAIKEEYVQERKKAIKVRL